MTLPRRARLTIFVAVAGGAGSLAATAPDIYRLAHLNARQWWTIGAIGTIMVYSWMFPALLHLGDSKTDTGLNRTSNNSEAFHLDEAFFVCMALLLPSVAVLVTIAFATLLAQVVRQRPPVKAAYNTGQVLMSAGLGLVVLHLLAPPAFKSSAQSLTLTTLAAGALAVVVYVLVNAVMLASLFVGLGATWKESMLDGLSAKVALAMTGMTAGLLLAVAVAGHTWAVAFAPPAMLGLRFVLARQFDAVHDRSRMTGLFNVTLEANRRLRAESVLETIIDSAQQLLRCPDAQVTEVDPSTLGLDPRDVMYSAIETEMGIRWLLVSGRPRSEPFDHADQILLDALAAIAKGALTNADLYKQVRYERERLSSITLNIGEGVCAVDAEGRLTFANPAAAAMVHLPSLSVSIVDGVADEAMRAPDYLAEVAFAAMDGGEVVTEDDVRFPGRDGESVPVSYTSSPVIDGGVPVGAVITFRDITERKAHEDEMIHHAYYDELTGLANRRLLVERLDDALTRSVFDAKIHSLIFVDVDRFKSINDSLGHVTGDDLLVAIAGRMRNVVRTTDLLARFGGDEFILLLEDIAGVEEAVAAAKRICAAVEEPIVLSHGYEIVASLSVGIALTEPGKTSDDILRDADVAMYEAKIKGRGGAYEVFDIGNMGSRSSDRLQLEAALRKGIDRDELEVHYQPFFTIEDQRIVGAEALVRWRHPTLGLLEPGRFIELAEETGLILPIGRCVMEMACQQNRAVLDRLGISLPISVNLSPRQFQRSSLVNDVGRILDAQHLEPTALMFEITETMVMDDLASARDVMTKLNHLGVGLAIDDFGTGHSSLGYLKEFPVQEVKVDRIFVKEVATHPVDSAIVRAVVDLASAMGITAVAEGVETLEQLDSLKKLGCPVGQGYYFARPLPVSEFDELLGRYFKPKLRALSDKNSGRLVS